MQDITCTSKKTKAGSIHAVPGLRLNSHHRRLLCWVVGVLIIAWRSMLYLWWRLVVVFVLGRVYGKRAVGFSAVVLIVSFWEVEAWNPRQTHRRYLTVWQLASWPFLEWLGGEGDQDGPRMNCCEGCSHPAVSLRRQCLHCTLVLQAVAQ